MASTVFINGITLTDADWFNDTNRVTYDLLDDAATKVATLDALTLRGADIASATTLNLNAATGDAVDVTGTTTITAITLTDGNHRITRFTGALVLTHGASLVLPGAVNITTVAGDFAIWRGYAAGVVRCVYFSRNGGAVIATTITATGASTISAGDSSTLTVGPNASFSKSIRYGHYAISLPANTAQCAVANLDLHLDPPPGAGFTRINSQGGSGGVVFSNGATVAVAQWDNTGKQTLGTVPLARMGTVDTVGTTTIAANQVSDAPMDIRGAVHSFYQISVFCNAASSSTIAYGSFVSFVETVEAVIHAFVYKTTGTTTSFRIVNGYGVSVTVDYKVYRLTET